MANPKTQEYLEAEQAAANIETNKLLESASEDARNKFGVVRDATKILKDNNIYYILFPLLPMLAKDNRNIVWEYSSIVDLTQFDSGEKPTKKSEVMSNILMDGVISVLFHNICANYLPNETPQEDKFEFFQKYIFKSLNNYSKYYYAKHIPE